MNKVMNDVTFLPGSNQQTGFIRDKIKHDT